MTRRNRIRIRIRRTPDSARVPRDEQAFWDIARSVEVRPAPAGGAGSASAGSVSAGSVSVDEVVGVVHARPHPAGWFFRAEHRPGLAADERAEFAEFVAVRVFLLLTEGPVVGTWAPGDGEDDWVAVAERAHLDLADLVPDVVPAHWG